VQIINITSKRLLTAREDNAPNIWIIVVVFKRLVQFHEQVVAKRVKGFGTVQCDQANLAAGLGKDMGVA
jgi:hypothetical protein